MNAAETWIDIEKLYGPSASHNFVKNSHSGVNCFFMSETGIYDVFFTLGPRPNDVMRQYSKLTGTAPLPPVSNFQSFAKYAY